MSIRVNILLKGPKEFEDGPDVIVTEAVDYIPRETIEQLVSRLLYHNVHSHTRGLSPDKLFRFAPWGAASEQVIEIRLVREVL